MRHGSMVELTILAEKVFRIGLQRLLVDNEGQYYAYIKNRTYESLVPIPTEKVPIWKEILRN